MAVADNRQRYMPMPEDRLPGRGQPLAYKEAVLLVDPVEPEFKGEVQSNNPFFNNSSNTSSSTWMIIRTSIYHN